MIILLLSLGILAEMTEFFKICQNEMHMNMNGMIALKS